MAEFSRDLRFGFRLLAKRPVFTITAALLLAVGISSNTLIYSVIDATLLRPPMVSHPENLVRLIEVHPRPASKVHPPGAALAGRLSERGGAGNVPNYAATETLR
jgi:hypothetical protein